MLSTKDRAAVGVACPEAAAVLREEADVLYESVTLSAYPHGLSAGLIKRSMLEDPRVRLHTRLLTMNTGREHVVQASLLKKIVQATSPLLGFGISAATNLDASMVGTMVKGWSNLRLMHIGYSLKLSDAGLEKLANKTPRLMSLSIPGCAGVTDAGVIAVLRKCAKLESLDVSLGTPPPGSKLTQALFDVLGSDSMEGPLRELRMSGLDHPTSVAAVVRRHRRTLHLLDVSHCTQLRDEAFDFFDGDEEAHCELRSIDLSFCERMTYTGFKSVSRACPKLVSIDLGSTTRLHWLDRVAGYLGRMQPGLRRVSLRKAHRITDEGLDFLSDDLKQLQELDLFQQSRITDEGLVFVAQSCAATLRALDVSGCTGLTVEGLGRIKELVGLESLACEGSLVLTNDVLLVWASTLRGLKRLNLANCARVTGSGMAILLVRQQWLEWLNVARMRGFGDETMLQLVLHCPNLEYLNIHGCSDVTADLLRELAFCCPKLEELDIRFVPLEPDDLHFILPLLLQLKRIFYTGYEEDWKGVRSFCKQLVCNQREALRPPPAVPRMVLPSSRLPKPMVSAPAPPPRSGELAPQGCVRSATVA